MKLRAAFTGMGTINNAPILEKLNLFEMNGASWGQNISAALRSLLSPRKVGHHPMFEIAGTGRIVENARHIDLVSEIELIVRVVIRTIEEDMGTPCMSAGDVHKPAGLRLEISCKAGRKALAVVAHGKRLEVRIVVGHRERAVQDANQAKRTELRHRLIVKAVFRPKRHILPCALAGKNALAGIGFHIRNVGNNV